MKPSYQDALAYYGVGGAHPGGLTLTKEILSKEHINKDIKILDAGCGTGHTSAFLSKTYHCHVTALDYNPVMVEWAKQRFLKEKIPVAVIRGSTENLPFSDHSFDMIIAESVTVFTRIKHSLKEYYRVLKPSGILLNMDMTAECQLIPQEITRIKKVYGIQNVLTENEWLRHFANAGFPSAQIIVSQSMHSEMLNSPYEDPKIENLQFNPYMAGKILEHQELLSQFGKKLGYRVFRAVR